LLRLFADSIWINTLRINFYSFGVLFIRPQYP
jgi:hypothetical protein